MVSRTRIPIAMYPEDYTPLTPDGVVTPAVMTKSGSGEPLTKVMIQDYPCGDEPGHAFRSSPLNIYSIARDSAVVLYVEGGCPNFTWASDNAWATFGTAATAVRYNTLTSSADEGQDTIVTVTDANGLEATISVPYNDASTCCEDVPMEFAKQTPWDEITSVSWPNDVVVFLDGGCPPFDWTIIGANFTLDYAATNSRRNRLHGAVGADSDDIYLTIEDLCGSLLCYPGVLFSGDCFSVNRGGDLTVTAARGVAPIAWEFVGSSTGWSLAEAQTADLDNVVSLEADAPIGTVTLKCTDTNGCTETQVLYTAGVVDSHEFDEADCIFPWAIQLSTNYYAVVYESTGDDGWIKTFHIPSGTGIITEVDSYEYSTAAGEFSMIVHIYGNIYAITDRSGYIRTIEISDAGVITKSIISSRQITGATSNINYIVHVGGSIYAVFWGSPYGRSVSTYTIGNGGDISVAIDTYSPSIANNVGSAIKVYTDIYAWIYCYDSANFVVQTFKIAVDGTITKSLQGNETIKIDATWSNGNHDFTNVVEVASNIFAFCHFGSDSGKSVVTFQVNDDGSVETAVIDSLICDAYNSGSNPFLVYSGSGDLYYVIYQGTDGDGFIRSIKITSAGVISDYAPCGGVEFETSSLGNNAFALPPEGSILPIFYQGVSADGFVSVIDISGD